MVLLRPTAAALSCFATVIRLTAAATALGTISNPPTLFIAGDSTAAKDDGSPELLGWGEKIGQYLSIPVVNDAISGATMRTYTEGGNCESSLTAFNLVS
jgi:lysophospholipase L1-like esterase